MKSFYTIKRDQIHAYNKNGKRLFVTRLSANSLPVVQVKNQEKDKYSALQIALGKKSRLNKPEAGHVKEIAKTPRYLKEIRLEKDSELKTGDQIKIDQVLHVGDVLKVTSISKGKGFAGGMKRHGFHGGPRTHGQSDRDRAPGAIGQGTSPGRIWKGKRMAGHMGNETVTIMGAIVVKIDQLENEIWITGSVPGGKNAVVELTKLRESKFVGLLETNKVVKTEEINKVTADKVEIEKTETVEVANVSKETKEDIKEEVKEENIGNPDTKIEEAK